MIKIIIIWDIRNHDKDKINSVALSAVMPLISLFVQNVKKEMSFCHKLTQIGQSLYLWHFKL